MADYTTTELLASVRQRASIPTSQSTFTATKLLRTASEELRNEITPYLLRVRENYFLTSKDYTVTAAQANYLMPERAIGEKIQTVKLLDVNYQELPLTRVDIEQITDVNRTGTPENFYIQGSDIYLYPTPDLTANTLRVYYYARPSALVETSACGLVVSKTSTTVTINATAPTGFGSSATVDFVRGRPPFKLLSTDVACTVSGTTITFVSGTIPSTLAAGDYIALAGETPIPTIPYDLFPILYQRVAVKVLEAIGDDAGYQRAAVELERLEKNQMPLISNRIDKKPKVFGVIGNG
jgi:hypothetical protein